MLCSHVKWYVICRDFVYKKYADYLAINYEVRIL